MADEVPHAASRTDVPRALREAAIAGLIALALFTPLVGFHTVQNIRNELVLETRWPLLAALVLIIAAARFLQVLLVEPWRARRASRAHHKTANIASPRSCPGLHRSPSALPSPTRSSC